MVKKALPNWCFENAYITVSAAMHVVRTHPFIPRNRVWVLQFLVLTVMNASCLFFLSNSIFLHDAKSGKYMDASKNFSMLIVCLNSTMKYYTMIYYRESIASLIKTIDRDYEVAKDLNKEEQNIILSFVNQAKLVSYGWILIAIATSSIFPVKAFYLMTYYYCKGEGQLVPMFDLTFPNSIEKYKTEYLPFLGVFSLCFIFDWFAGLVYMGFEPLIPIFTLHTCGQLELLNLIISKIFSESENEKELKEKFKKINVKLQELYSFVSCIQKNFMTLMEFNMKSTIIILPCNAFLLIEEYRNNNVINVEFIFLTVAFFIHFLSPCYYCDLLMESGANLRQAIYACGWENCCHMSIRKTVLLMLTRSSKPLNISTIFYSISLDTFSTMCRQAYAIFNLMTAAWT